MSERVSKSVELQVLTEVAAGHTTREIGRTHDIDNTTVSEIMARYGVISSEASQRALKVTGNAAMRLAMRVWDHLAQLPQSDLKRINPAQLTVMAGIATDKANILLGKDHQIEAPNWEKLMAQPKDIVDNTQQVGESQIIKCD
jgi:hypothetical protein